MRDSLALAFHDDPIASWLFGRPANRIRDLSSFFTIQIRHGYLPRGVVMTTEDFQATAMWISSWTRPLSMYDRFAHLQIPFLLGNNFAPARQLTRDLARYHPREPHLYLGTIGTSPRLQSHGYGSQLIEAFLEDARMKQVGSYLECSSEHNLGFYERYGFRVEREVQAPEGGPTLWLMWRKAEVL